MREEIWRTVDGYEGFYEVSSAGRVRSVGRTISHGVSGQFRRVRGRVLARATNKQTGYLYVNLWRDGEGITVAVHSLVATAWYGPCPEGLQCAHGDGDRTNPAADNLSWVTRVENMSHCIAHGTVPEGERNGQAKLIVSEVGEIRKRFASGEMRASIADAFDISVRNVYKIANRESWARTGASDPAVNISSNLERQNSFRCKGAP